jgi:hypothetical protein
MLDAAVRQEEGAIVEVAAGLDVANVASRHEHHGRVVLEVAHLGLVVHLLHDLPALQIKNKKFK